MLKKLHNYSALRVNYFILFALLPFVYSDSVIDPVLLPRQAFLTLFLLLTWTFIFVSGKLKNTTLLFSNLSLLLIISSALLVILSFISCIYSTVVSESIYIASKYGIIFLFFITTCFLIRAGLILKSDLVNGVLVFCVLSLCYGIYDILSLTANNIDILTHADLVNATYANKNLFASVLILCFWAIFAGNLHYLFRSVLIILLAVFILLIQSKIAGAVFTGMLLFYVIRNAGTYFKKNRRAVIICSLLAFIVLLLLAFNFYRFGNLTSLHTLDTRYSLWSNSFKMAGENPFGVGSGNWQVFFPKYGLSYFDLPEVKNGMTIYHQPHNDFIWILCELGIQGLTVYLSIFLLVLLMLVRIMRRENKQLPFLLLISIIGYCAIAFFDFPLERIEHQVLLSVIIVLSMNDYDIVSVRHRTIVPLRYNSVYTALIMISLIVCYYRLKGEYFTRRFIFSDRSEQAESVITNCDKAGSFFYRITPVSVPLDWYAGVSLFSRNKPEAAKLRFEKAREYAPYNIHVLFHLGTIYEKLGEHSKAAECFQTAHTISPSARIAPLK